MINKFSTLQVATADGNTVSSFELSGSRIYADIGSGTVFKLYWDTPTATGNAVDYYTLYMYVYNDDGSIQTIINRGIGNINEFYITSDMLAVVTQVQYQINIQLTAVSVYGAAYNGTSEVLTATVSKACGTYIKVTDGYPQPIMKRALAFAKLSYLALVDAEGKAIKDAEGKALYAKAARTQDVAVGWALMQEFSAKDAKSNTWHSSDIRYEVLTTEDGEIITDLNDEHIFVL